MGGIVKGYVAQVIRNFCKKQGIEKALMNAGGDLTEKTKEIPMVK